MAEQKKLPSATKTFKKNARTQVEQKLAQTLAYLLSELGEKKFKRRMKDAAKLIMQGISVPKAKKAVPVKTKIAATKAPSKKAEKPKAKKTPKK